MKTLNYVLHPVKKFTKGMFALLMLNLLIVSIAFIVESCQKVGKIDDGAKDKFFSALKLNKESIGSVSFNRGITRASFSETNLQPVYLNFPSQVTTEVSVMFQNTNTIQDLSNLISYTHAILEYEPNPINVDYQINVPVQLVENSIQPLIAEAKQYLYAKGLTEAQIQNMIVTEGGTESDLIPLVMVLSDIEGRNPEFACNYPKFSLFMNTAYAANVLDCAAEALGVDAIWAVAFEGASGWSLVTITQVFKSVAKRFLGPIGVAIAVVAFTWCMFS